jgi:hypothetical protein
MGNEPTGPTTNACADPPAMRDTRTVSDPKPDLEAERRGEERAEAAHERLELARGRAVAARREAADAGNSEAAAAHRKEAEVHDAGVRLQGSAEKLQREHIDEARRGGAGASARSEP